MKKSEYGNKHSVHKKKCPNGEAVVATPKAVDELPIKPNLHLHPAVNSIESNYIPMKLANVTAEFNLIIKQ